MEREKEMVEDVAEDMVVEEEEIITTEEEREDEPEDVEDNSLEDMTVRGSEVPIFILETLSTGRIAHRLNIGLTDFTINKFQVRFFTLPL